jgi:hypothetical protein
MGQGKLIHAIRAAVRDERLRQPFRAEDVKCACPGFCDKTYPVFLPKHRRGNPGCNTELFDRVDQGLYRLLNL